MKAKISILMPVFNAEQQLESAINSILLQSFAHFELIIVDDGSEDKSCEIIKKFIKKDHRIKLIEQEHLGITTALNHAISKAEGQYIARQDADDISMPDRIQKQYLFLQNNPDIDICSTYAWIANNDMQAIYSFTFPTENSSIQQYLKKGINPIVHGSTMFRKSILKKLNVPPYRFRLSQDFDMWLRLTKFAKFAIIPEELYIYCRGDNSLSFNYNFLKKELKKVMMQLHNERESLGGKEHNNWKSLEDECFANHTRGAANFTGNTKDQSKSYTSAYLALLAGAQFKALQLFISRFRFRNLPLMILCMLPLAGSILARKLHLKISPFSTIKWKNHET